MLVLLLLLLSPNKLLMFLDAFFHNLLIFMPLRLLLDEEGVEATPQRQEEQLQQPVRRIELWQEFGEGGEVEGQKKTGWKCSGILLMVRLRGKTL